MFSGGDPIRPAASTPDPLASVFNLIPADAAAPSSSAAPAAPPASSATPPDAGAPDAGIDRELIAKVLASPSYMGVDMSTPEKKVDVVVRLLNENKSADLENKTQMLFNVFKVLKLSPEKKPDAFLSVIDADTSAPFQAKITIIGRVCDLLKVPSERKLELIVKAVNEYKGGEPRFSFLFFKTEKADEVAEEKVAQLGKALGLKLSLPDDKRYIVNEHNKVVAEYDPATGEIKLDTKYGGKIASKCASSTAFSDGAARFPFPMTAEEGEGFANIKDTSIPDSPPEFGNSEFCLCTNSSKVGVWGFTVYDSARNERVSKLLGDCPFLKTDRKERCDKIKETIKKYQPPETGYAASGIHSTIAGFGFAIAGVTVSGVIALIVKKLFNGKGGGGGDGGMSALATGLMASAAAQMQTNELLAEVLKRSQVKPQHPEGSEEAEEAAAEKAAEETAKAAQEAAETTATLAAGAAAMLYANAKVQTQSAWNSVKSAAPEPGWNPGFVAAVAVAGCLAVVTMPVWGGPALFGGSAYAAFVLVDKNILRGVYTDPSA